MLCTNIVLNIKTKKQFLYTTCSKLVFLGEFNEQSLVILWGNWCKNEDVWKRFTWTTNPTENLYLSLVNSGSTHRLETGPIVVISSFSFFSFFVEYLFLFISSGITITLPIMEVVLMNSGKIVKMHALQPNQGETLYLSHLELDANRVPIH